MINLVISKELLSWFTIFSLVL